MLRFFPLIVAKFSSWETFFFPQFFQQRIVWPPKLPSLKIESSNKILLPAQSLNYPAFSLVSLKLSTPGIFPFAPLILMNFLSPRYNFPLSVPGQITIVLLFPKESRELSRANPPWNFQDRGLDQRRFPKKEFPETRVFYWLIVLLFVVF